MLESKILDKKRLPVRSLLDLQGDFKTLGKKQFEKLKNSIKKNGFIQPFFVWKDGDKNYILDGHQRKKAIIDLYGDTIDVDCLEIRAQSILEAKKLCIYYASSYAEFDKESFINFADGLSFDDVEDFEFPGFKLNEDDFLNTEDEGDDEIPEVAQNECGVELGDVYTLGEHRLMCGDSSDFETLEKLMNGQKVSMVFTDPPYGVNFEQGKFIGREKQGKNRNFKPIENDNLKGADLESFLKGCFENIIHFVEVSSFYIWSPSMLESFSILKAAIESGIHMQSQIIWNKTPFVIGRADYHWKHEVCWYGYYGKNHQWYGGRDKSTVWDVKKTVSSDKHPTMKPEKLAEIACFNSSKSGDVVLDIFGGSGSTLIACEKTKHKCSMMELDPHYCSVIIKRWEQYTGQKAVKNA